MLLKDCNGQLSTKVPRFYSSSIEYQWRIAPSCFVKVGRTTGIKFANTIAVMTIPDILIIYFSFGAPFAVYQFIQDRKTSKFRLVFDTVFHFLFWLPLMLRYGLAFILKSAGSNDFAETDDSDAELENVIRKSQSDITDHFRTSARHISINEFREILDRYVGLSLLVKHQVSGMVESHHALFAITDHQDVRLAAICFERRNREHIFRHHIDARADFLKVMQECAFPGDRMLLSAIGLAKLLKDLPASATLLENLYGRNQGVREISGSGEDLWLPEIRPASKSERLTATT